MRVSHDVGRGRPARAWADEASRPAPAGARLEPMMEEIVKLALDTARGKFPPKPRVVELRHRIGQDATGESAVWVWVVLADDTPKTMPHSSFAPIAEQIRAAIAEALKSGTQFQIDLVPYVRFRLKSEQEEIDRVGAA